MSTPPTTVPNPAPTRYREPTNAELGLEPASPVAGSSPAPQRPRHGGAKRRVAAALGVVVLVGAVAYAVAPVQDVHDTWASPTGITLVTIEIDGGDVEVVPSDTGAVTFTEDLHYRGFAPRVSHSVSGSTLAINAGASRVIGLGGETRLRYRIGVPSGVDVTYRLQGGSTTLNGSFGTLSVRLEAGELTSSSIKASSLSVTMAAGDVSLGQVSAERFALQMSAGHAVAALVTPPQSTALQLSAGEADITLPGSTSYALTQQHSAGSVDAQIATDPASPHAVSVNLAAGHVVLRKG